YHLLTNEPPAEARKRFLNSRSLTPPIDINPRISSHVEKAIFWAMALHPNDRPVDVLTFRDALFGKIEVPIQVDVERYGFETPRFSVFSTEQIAGYVAFGLFLVGLLATVIR
ncbi:MAG TPA: serine/threonine protein kinase, partial [Anaerolineales bacterium]|nr:serine/threonine protein kinase [Anaerolineales bacterium]